MQVFIRFILTSFFVSVMFILPLMAQIEELDFTREDIKTENSSPEEKTDTNAGKSLDSENDLVHAGDLVDVDILGSTEYDWRGRVTPEGFLSGLNFIDNVFVRCRTADKIALEIAELYTKFLRKPQVRVRILDRSNRPVSSLLGAVKMPQKYQLKRKVLLNELLIISGGLTEEANGEIQILRREENQCLEPLGENQTAQGEVVKIADTPEKKPEDQAGGLKIISVKVSDLLSGDPEHNPQIFYGDVITVLGAEPIFVIGGVGNPGRILFRKDLTVSRAISIAGGIAKKGEAEQIRIYRRGADESGGTSVIEVNLDSIKSNEAEDIQLQPFDVIDVSGRGGERRFPSDLGFEISKTDKNTTLPLRVID